MKQYLASVLFLAATALGWAQVPQNDFFTNRIQLSGAVVEFEANTTEATWGESACEEPWSSDGYSNTVWWSWTAPESSPVILERLPVLTRWRLNYPNFAYARLSVFASTNLCELPLHRVCEIGLLNYGQHAAFQAQAGVEYTIQMAGGIGTNSFHFRLMMTNAPVFRLQPVSQVVPIGDSAMLSVHAIGLSPVHFQWSQDGKLLAGATNRMVAFDNISLENAGEYCVVVSNLTGMNTSQVARLTVATNVMPPRLVAHPDLSGNLFRFSVVSDVPRRYRVETPQDLKPPSGLWYFTDVVSVSNDTTVFLLRRDTPSKFVRLSFHREEAVCVNNLEQIRTAIWFYAEDHHLAVTAGLETDQLAAPGYLINGTWPQCPNAVGDQTNSINYIITTAYSVPLCEIVPAVHWIPMDY